MISDGIEKGADSTPLNAERFRRLEMGVDVFSTARGWVRSEIGREDR